MRRDDPRRRGDLSSQRVPQIQRVPMQPQIRTPIILKALLVVVLVATADTEDITSIHCSRYHWNTVHHTRADSQTPGYYE